MSALKHVCKLCKEKNEREVSWIDPKSFKGKPQMRSVFWCNNNQCAVAIALLLEFKPNNEVVIVREESTADIYDPGKEELHISARPKASKAHH